MSARAVVIALGLLAMPARARAEIDRGLTMAGIGHETDRPRLKGAGLTLALEMVATLGFDIVAARRAHGYRAELASVDVQIGIDPLTNVPTALVVRRGRF